MWIAIEVAWIYNTSGGFDDDKASSRSISGSVSGFACGRVSGGDYGILTLLQIFAEFFDVVRLLILPAMFAKTCPKDDFGGLFYFAFEEAGCP